MIDQIFYKAFSSAHVAIFEIGSVMALLMLFFGILDYKYGDRLRDFIIRKKLDRSFLMTMLSLIPVDGTLLFQYNVYRRGGIRLGSLLGGIIGIGEEATYIILSYNPLAWVIIALIKLLVSTIAGGSLNVSKKARQLEVTLRQKDRQGTADEAVLEADENFHELPDKYRHKLHHFRYHDLGVAFWIFFAVAFVLEMVFKLLQSQQIIDAGKLVALDIPFVSWLSMIALGIVFMYWVFVKSITREFGKIFEHEFDSTTDAIGDLAETCSSIILLIFVMTFVIDSLVTVIGTDRLSDWLGGRGFIAVLIAALIGLIPGTGASLAFTTLYFTLAGTPGAMPFAALAACSIALIGDSQFIGGKLIRHSQRVAHLIAFVLALVVGFIVLAVETYVI